MRKGGGKQKGAQFERDVCVKLSRWVSNGDREDIFWRSAMSGGRATLGRARGKRHSAQVGDISCIHPCGHRFIEAFAPECKNYANLDYPGLLTGKGNLIKFWAEISKQASDHNKLPFLVAKQNRFPTFVCLNDDGRVKLMLHERRFALHSPQHDMWLIEAEKFFRVCTPYVETQFKMDTRPKIRLRLNAR